MRIFQPFCENFLQNRECFVIGSTQIGVKMIFRNFSAIFLMFLMIFWPWSGIFWYFFGIFLIGRAIFEAVGMMFCEKSNHLIYFSGYLRQKIRSSDLCTRSRSVSGFAQTALFPCDTWTSDSDISIPVLRNAAGNDRVISWEIVGTFTAEVYLGENQSGLKEPRKIFQLWPLIG